MAKKKMLVDQYSELASAVVRAIPRNMDTETAQGWIMDQDRLKLVLAAALLPEAEKGDEPAERPVTPPAIEYFTPVPDADVPERHQPTLSAYRKLATDHGVSAATAVCYRVRAGFTLKNHAPKAGPCYKNFQYLQGWKFPDEPTTVGLVFWVPRIVDGSTSKTRREQEQILSDLRTKLELSDQHLAGFGKVALVAGLILAHHKATGERIPLDQHWVRTDTCNADGYRLYLGIFDDAGLHCPYWSFDEDAYDFLGVFALGVEALGN